MIINNGAYLNYLNTHLPSNDLNALKDDADKQNNTADIKNTAVNGKPNDTANPPANMDNVDINPNTKDIKDNPNTKDVKNNQDIKNNKDNKDVKDTKDVKDGIKVEEVESETAAKPKFEWKYNTTKDGYLPEFQLGEWEKTSQTLFGENVMKIEERSFSVFLPKELQDKMAKDPELAKQINEKLEAFFNDSIKENGKTEDGTEFHVVSQQIAVSMDADGNIMHSYIRTESYSTNGALPPAANDENALGNPEVKPEEEEHKDLNAKYGFAMYKSTLMVSSKDKEISETEKNANAMAAIGVHSVITAETAQIQGEEPVTKIRKANGDIVELETGKLIQKHAGYLDNSQKYDAKV